MRVRTRLQLDWSAPLVEPQGPVLQFVTRISPSAPPLEAMLVGVESDDLLVYFPGFNVPLGPWEAAKSRLLASAFGAQVLAVELPGMSRFGDALPRSVRLSMLRGEIREWAELLFEYQTAALDALSLSARGVRLLGYSTGCGLAATSATLWRERAPLASITLIEPVSTAGRSLVQLGADNLIDVLRQPPSYRTNHGHEWVMRTRRRQLREPWIRYGPADLVAICQVLAQAHLPGTLALDEHLPVNLVRGARSDLCAAGPFEELDRTLESAGVPGTTILVPGMGHPLWHSFPVLFPLIAALGGTQQGGGSAMDPPAPR